MLTLIKQIMTHTCNVTTLAWYIPVYNYAIRASVYAFLSIKNVDKKIDALCSLELLVDDLRCMVHCSTINVRSDTYCSQIKRARLS